MRHWFLSKKSQSAQSEHYKCHIHQSIKGFETRNRDPSSSLGWNWPQCNACSPLYVIYHSWLPFPPWPASPTHPMMAPKRSPKLERGSQFGWRWHLPGGEVLSWRHPKNKNKEGWDLNFLDPKDPEGKGDTDQCFRNGISQPDDRICRVSNCPYMETLCLPFANIGIKEESWIHLTFVLFKSHCYCQTKAEHWRTQEMSGGLCINVVRIG